MKIIPFLLAWLLLPLTVSAQSEIYDVNDDGDVTIADVMCIVDWVMNAGGQDEPQSYLFCPDDQHPHLIDLGLPDGTKWACCNMNAETPEDLGGYYAWGDTEAKTYFDTSSYIHYDSKTKTYSEVDDFAGTEFDAASKEWGEEWRTPTKQQAEVLLANCSLEWVTENSVEGARLTGANGGSIFLPATGYRIYSFLCDDFEGSYWTSTPVSSTSSSAYRLEVASEWAGMDKSLSKIYGNALRPVSAVTGSDFLRYDVNKDGSVGVTDVMLLVNWIMNTESE